MKDGTQEEKDKLWKTVQDFVEKQDIICSETIYQTDGVIINSYEFIDDLVQIVGFKPSEDEEDEE